MTIKEQLFREIESAPESLLAQTLDFLQFIKTKQRESQPVVDVTETPATEQQTTVQSTGRSLLEHLKTVGSWEGDDLEECLQVVYETRGKAKFNYDNHFE
ncbi:DUF2281 domain-containing protein [Brasilonema sp. CT11]|nr:DUF2281 domain-containing protein [Brasilonema sp. CT11]